MKCLTALLSACPIVGLKMHSAAPPLPPPPTPLAKPSRPHQPPPSETKTKAHIFQTAGRLLLLLPQSSRENETRNRSAARACDRPGGGVHGEHGYRVKRVVRSALDEARLHCACSAR